MNTPAYVGVAVAWAWPIPEQTFDDVADRLPRKEFLSRLSTTLPEAVYKYTPDGLPSTTDVSLVTTKEKFSGIVSFLSKG